MTPSTAIPGYPTALQEPTTSLVAPRSQPDSVDRQNNALLRNKRSNAGNL
jgi:hypothetical protein